MEEHHISYISLMIVVAITGIGFGTLFSTQFNTMNVGVVTPPVITETHFMLVVALLLFVAFLLWGRQID